MRSNKIVATIFILFQIQAFAQTDSLQSAFQDSSFVKTTATSVIDRQVITQIKSANVLEALQGNMAGVDIIRNSGNSGSDYTIAFRGHRQINATNWPYTVHDEQFQHFIIIDGKPHYGAISLAPAQIESIEILKGPAAQSKYGFRGNNGIISITTQEASSKPLKVEISSYYGISEKSGDLNFIDNKEYIEVLNDYAWTKALREDPTAQRQDDAFYNALNPSDYPDNNTDWFDVITRTGAQQQHLIQLSGTNPWIRYKTHYNYFNEKGLLYNDDFNRNTFGFDLGTNFSKRFSLDIGVLNSIANKQQNYYAMSYMLDMNPLMKPYKDDGSINDENYGGKKNPLIFNDKSQYDYYKKTKSTKIYGMLSWEILPNRLIYQSTMSREYARIKDKYNNYEFFKTYNTNFYNELTFHPQKNKSWIITAGHEHYNRKYQWAKSTYDFENIQWEIYDQFGHELSDDIYYHTSDYPINSLFITNHYTLSNKYASDLTIRYDQQLKLLTSSAALGWRIDREKFLASHNFISLLNLRAAYKDSKTNKLDTAYYSIANDEWNIGFDWGLWGNRISGSIEFYNQNTSAYKKLNGYNGYSTNIFEQKTENKGTEITLNVTPINSKNYHWKINGYATLNKEKLQSYGVNGSYGDKNDYIFLGYPIGTTQIRNVIGIWQNDEAEAAAAQNSSPGYIKYGSQVQNGQEFLIISNTPKSIFGFNTTFRMKQTSLYIGGYGRFKYYIKDFATFRYTPTDDNIGVIKNNYWTPNNDNADYPSLVSVAGYAFPYVDGSYFKIKDIALTYDLQKAAQKMKMEAFSISISVKNAFIFGKYYDNGNRLDPENQGFIFDSPFTKVYALSVNLSF